MNAINKLKLSLSAVLFSFLGIACSDIDDNLVNYPVVAEVNTVYYIDSESGNDANSGESESSAWKTFANINRVIFQAGNRILLKRGSVWTGLVHLPIQLFLDLMAKEKNRLSMEMVK